MSLKKKRLFQCKMEELPVIAEFLVSRLEKDYEEFSKYSPKVFTPNYLQSVREKIIVCKETPSSSIVTKKKKAVTTTLRSISKTLRLKLNVLEGYLKLAASKLDVPVADMGLKKVRQEITRGNTEGVIAETSKLLVFVKQNQDVLVDVGFNPDLLTEIEAQIRDIDRLNLKQNDLMDDRNLQTVENIDIFNDLWLTIQPIMETAKALYRGMNPAKLRAYTFSQLKKRINAEKGRGEENN